MRNFNIFNGDYVISQIVSLYAVNLPSQCVEEASTIIRPTLNRTHFQSQSCEEEEEGTLLSSDLSMQGTFESLRESFKSNAKSQILYLGESGSSLTKPNGMNRGLKKSKTYISLGGKEKPNLSSAARASRIHGLQIGNLQILQESNFRDHTSIT